MVIVRRAQQRAEIKLSAKGSENCSELTLFSVEGEAALSRKQGHKPNLGAELIRPK